MTTTALLLFLLGVSSVSLALFVLYMGKKPGISFNQIYTLERKALTERKEEFFEKKNIYFSNIFLYGGAGLFIFGIIALFVEAQLG